MCIGHASVAHNPDLFKYHFSRDKYLIVKIVYPYSYLDLNNCWLTMIIEKTFELITCDSHSQEMNFMPYLFVLFYLMSSHREIRLNRTLLRHANIYFLRFYAFDWNLKSQNRTPSFIYLQAYLCPSCLHQYLSVVVVLLWLHIVHNIYFTLYMINKIIHKLCY